MDNTLKLSVNGIHLFLPIFSSFLLSSFPYWLDFFQHITTCLLGRGNLNWKKMPPSERTIGIVLVEVEESSKVWAVPTLANSSGLYKKAHWANRKQPFTMVSASVPVPQSHATSSFIVNKLLTVPPPKIPLWHKLILLNVLFQK